MIDRLLEKGLLERVEPDAAAGREVLAEASRHLDSAGLIATRDPNGAYQLLYDAARKALVAHMLRAGFRVAKGKPGGHETTGRYGVATIDTGPAKEAMANFDRLRRNRNRSEYELRFFDEAEVHADLAHARAIVEAIAASF